MSIRESLILLAALTLAACGGGGGDNGSGGGGGDGGGDGGGGDGGGGDGSGGDGDPILNGTAKIVFPWTHSTATAPSVSIRGTAADPEGVASVSINGAAATITATGAASSGNRFAKSGLREGEAEWSAEVELENGENELVISVEDATGDVTENVAAATITHVGVPVFFALDPDRTRLVGMSYAWTSSGEYVSHLVEHNYDTGAQTIFEADDLIAPASTCLRGIENEFLYLSFFTGAWELRKFDLTTEQDSLLLEIPDAALDPGDGFEPTPRRLQLVCGGTHTRAWVLVNYVDENGAGHSGSPFAKSRVLEVDLATQAVINLSETDTAISPRWIAFHIALAEGSLVSMREFGSDDAPLTGISLADGTRTELAPSVVNGTALEPALDYDRVYVATMEGVNEVDLVALTAENISPVDDDNPFVFSQPVSIGFDPANNRVIVGDSDLDTLVAIDITTGERLDILSRRVGTGITLIAPRSFALSADATLAYVADDGSNAPERLFEIDLASGDRRVIGDIGQPFNTFVSGLALDEAGGRAFLSFHDVILEVDLVTEDVQTIVSTDSSDLETINGLVLDIDNDRLLVGDFINDGIFALDLTTHAIDVISQESVLGTGPPFGGVVSLTRVAGSADLYVAGQTSETVVRVNLETGDREELSTGCDLGVSSTFQDLDQVLYNEALGELIISGATMYGLDLATAECAILPRRVSPLQLQVTPANQLLAVMFGSLVQLDRDTGEVVIVSK